MVFFSDYDFVGEYEYVSDFIDENFGFERVKELFPDTYKDFCDMIDLGESDYEKESLGDFMDYFGDDFSIADELILKDDKEWFPVDIGDSYVKYYLVKPRIVYLSAEEKEN